MSTVRLLFLAKYRVPHAVFSMQWDHNIVGVDQTIVISPVPKQELWPVFDRYGIDTATLEYINDQEFVPLNPEIEHWVFDDDYRGPWLRQQAVKLSALDYLDHDVMLMWDPDTFMIEPYQCLVDGQLNLMALLDTTQGSYNGQTENIIGSPRATPHCFVTELLAVRKKHLISLKNHLENRYHCHWLDAIIQHAPRMPTVPPWGTGNLIIWFSEYELLGNWAVLQESVRFHEQRRFEYDSLAKLQQLDPERFNAVCDAVPDLRWSMQLDWSSLTIENFELYHRWVCDALRDRS